MPGHVVSGSDVPSTMTFSCGSDMKTDIPNGIGSCFENLREPAHKYESGNGSYKGNQVFEEPISNFHYYRRKSDCTYHTWHFLFFQYPYPTLANDNRYPTIPPEESLSIPTTQPLQNGNFLYNLQPHLSITWLSALRSSFPLWISSLARPLNLESLTTTAPHVFFVWSYIGKWRNGW